MKQVELAPAPTTCMVSALSTKNIVPGLEMVGVLIPVAEATHTWVSVFRTAVDRVVVESVNVCAHAQTAKRAAKGRDRN